MNPTKNPFAHWYMPSGQTTQFCMEHYQVLVKDFLDGLDDLIKEAEEDSRTSWRRSGSVKNWSPRDPK